MDELVKALHETANWIVALATESRFAHDELNALHHEDTVRKAADAIEELMEERKQLVRCGECKYSREFDGKIEWCSRTMQYVPKDFHRGVKGLKS